MVPNHREISPFLKLVRDFLLGRKHVTNNRYAETVSARSQPPPNITGASPPRLFGNQYFTRDPRRQVMPPVDVVEEKKRELAAKEKEAKDAEAAALAAKTGEAPKPAGAAAPAAAAPKPAEKQAAKPATGPKRGGKGGDTALPKEAQKEQCKDKKGKAAKDNRKNQLPIPGKKHKWD